MKHSSPSSAPLFESIQGLLASQAEPADLNQLRQKIADRARDLVLADVVAVYAINPVTASDPRKRKFLLPPTISGDLYKSADFYNQAPRPDGVTQEILEEGFLSVDDTTHSSRYQSTFVVSEEIRSFAGVALRLGDVGKVLGIMYVDYRGPHAFSNVEKQDLLTYARFAAAALSSTWYLRRYQEVSRIGQEINRDLGTVESLFEKLQRHLPGIMDASQFMLLAIHQPQKGRLNLHLFEHGEYKVLRDVPLDGGCRWVIEQGKSLLVRELSREEEELRREGVNLVEIPGTKPEDESLIFVPLLLRNADRQDAVALGALSVQHEQPNMYDDEDVRILQALGHHLALAISNIGLFSGLERLAQSGQLLTRHLDSKQLLEQIVLEIQQVTQADIVVLYPYSQATERFDLPPKACGNFQQSNFPPHVFPRPDDIATLTVRRNEPVFARNSADLYERLGGDPARRQGNFEAREEITSTAAVPLRVGEEPVGALFVNYRVPQRFDAPQKQMIQALTNYAAIAIRNARLFGSLAQRHIKELELLRQIDARIGSILDLEELLQGILELAGEHVQADEASILLYDPRSHILDTVAAIGRNADVSRQQKVFLDDGRGIVREVFKQKTPVRIDNVRSDPVWHGRHLEVAADILSELDVPLVHNDQAIGVINMESTRESAFSQADQDFLVTLAGQAVLAIKNAEAYEREKRIAQERQALVDISREIVAQLNPRLVFAAILDKALEVTHCEAGNLMLYDSQRHDLWMAAQRGVMEDKIGRRQSLDEGLVGWVAMHQQLLNVNVCLSPWKETYVAYIPNVCSELVVPLLEGDRLRGVLNIESIERDHFKEHDERLLMALAGMAVIALHRLEISEASSLAEQRASAAEAMSAMGQSAFELAHRLGNDLGLVRTYTEHIEELLRTREGRLEEVDRELGKIRRDVDQVLRLSSGLKEIFQDYRHGSRPKQDPVELPPAVLLEEAVLSFPGRPENIQALVHVEPDTVSVVADHGQVADILRNLYTNAIQAMPQGGVVTLSAQNFGLFVEFQVSDTGVGISMDIQARIFDLFYSTRGSFGFGLWSARRNALANHGDLKVTSEPGRGATFTLLLPQPDAVMEGAGQ